MYRRRPSAALARTASLLLLLADLFSAASPEIEVLARALVTSLTAVVAASATFSTTVDMVTDRDVEVDKLGMETVHKLLSGDVRLVYSSVRETDELD